MADFDPETVAAFEVLGHDLRMGILEALAEKRAMDPQNPDVSFSELRDRVGIADSGQFNYHLGKLTGQFVQETDGGYELNAAGQEIIGALLAGSFETDDQWGPTELQAPCRECGDTVAAHYEDGVLAVECENGHLNHSDYVPGSIVERHSLPDAMELATLMAQQDLELLLRDVCPNCYRSIELRVILEDGQPLVAIQCHECGHSFQGPVSLAVLTHPVLRAFYLERGRDVRETPLWTLPLLTEPDRWHVKSENPLRIEIDASCGDGELTFLLDGDCTVLEYTVTDLYTDRN